jgi:hypothetical protein
MEETTAIRAVIDMIPHWYIAECGPHRHELSLGNSRIQFYSHRRLTPKLIDFIKNVNSELPELLEVADQLPRTPGVEFIQQRLAESWLKRIAASIEWDRLIDYMTELSQRTYENQRVTANFVITQGEGGIDITTAEIQKVIDPLATSMHTFLRIDHHLGFMGYEQILWQDISDTELYKFHPEFLQPVYSAVKDGEYSVHLTGRGDLVVMGRSGLLAAKRKGRWKLYDVYTFKNTITEVIGNYHVGCNLFEILFDLSFRRHGALLVYDPQKEVLRHVTNKGSIIEGKSSVPDVARSMLMPAIEEITMGHRQHSQRAKRLFLELASMDGALIFDKDSILAFGAMIEPHPEAKFETGARSTAARSAYLWGGHPLKISSDGEISIYFESSDRSGNKCGAKLEFL